MEYLPQNQKCLGFQPVGLVGLARASYPNTCEGISGFFTGWINNVVIGQGLKIVYGSLTSLTYNMTYLMSYMDGRSSRSSTQGNMPAELSATCLASAAL